ncbi:MAG: redox-sensing transcriptional repressor Rex [Oscillospiraceae bacterium]|nr:redox-sensing transcriptional repressor Rex [Oscillospiraceae bacterium]
MEKRSIPKATLGRVPVYLRYVRGLPDEIDSTISATKIARGVFLGEVQVRKDLALISGRGKPRVGYERDKLICDLENCLGSEKMTNAILVGAGKLGRALLDYDGFEEFGVKIVAGFDCNDSILQTGKSKSILPIKEIEAYCAVNDIKIGIITVGQGSAQEVCDRLVACGVKAIWNFAPCTLRVPPNVLLKHEELALSLAHLNSKI